jgi:acyl-CoA reductase-like NAD-dependent aldehyde dehydrogenase
VCGSKFGLQIGVYTSNLHKAEYAFEEAEVGGVVINDMPSLRVDSQV